MSLRFRIVFSSACALLALLLCVTYADGVRAEAEKVRSATLERFGGELTHLVVATERLEQGDVVSRSNVAERDWVSDLAPEDAYTSIDEVLGSEVGIAVAKGVPLTGLNFRKDDGAVEVPSGHVALTIPVTDKLGVSRSIAQGTSLVGYAVTAEGVRLVSSDMSVLSGAAATAGSLGTTLQITVAVLPSDVSAVLDASATGDLRLVVPAGDVSITSALGSQGPTDLGAVEGIVREGDDAS